MGLFGTKETCAVCGGKVGGLGKLKSTDGLICAECIKKCSPLASSLGLKSSREIAQHIQYRTNNLVNYQSFAPTDVVGDFLKVDRNSRTWCCPELDKKNPDIFSFDNLIGFELSEDGTTLTKGGLGSAVVGGAVFGGVGAIVGSNLGKKQKEVVNSMSISITLRDSFTPGFTLPIITTETKKGGLIYKGMKDLADQIVTLLSIISDSSTSKETPISSIGTSVADEILKLKELLDAGAITPEEFSTAKSQLLK